MFCFHTFLFTLLSCLVTTHAGEDDVEGGCNHGDLRLGERSNDTEELFSQGRLEICINGGWGTICDNRFSRSDAQVACSQLEYDDTGQLDFSVKSALCDLGKSHY